MQTAENRGKTQGCGGGRRSLPEGVAGVYQVMEVEVEVGDAARLTGAARSAGVSPALLLGSLIRHHLKGLPSYTDWVLAEYLLARSEERGLREEEDCNPA